MKPAGFSLHSLIVTDTNAGTHWEDNVTLYFVGNLNLEQKLRILTGQNESETMSVHTSFECDEEVLTDCG